MNAEKVIKKDWYYRSDHEWINFQGTVGYVGVCGFKLKGIRQIRQALVSANDVSKRQGETIATIRYDDYEVPINMPVDGKIIRINEAHRTGEQDIVLKQAESNVWIALITSNNHYERKNLLQPQQYKSILQRNVWIFYANRNNSFVAPG